jgi:DNA replication protein DnaC
MSDRNIIVVSGAPGCGKTVGAAWWALRRKTSTKFVRASTFAAASRYDRQERTVWLKASALVLDDAGAEYSDAKGSLMVDLDELLDTFYGDRRPLLITTNCSVADFKTRYGERITDRLRECGRWISVDGGSLRKKT